jgi:hypothetical protein
MMRIVYLRSALLRVLVPAALSVLLGCQSGGGMRKAGTGGATGSGGTTASGGATGTAGATGGTGTGGSGGSGGGGGGAATGDHDGAASTCQLDSACPDSGVTTVDPSCVPGSLACQDANLLTCDALGFWEVTRKCPYLCQAGACTGVCVPGSLGCRVSTVERCSDDATTWVDTEACGGSTPTCFDGKCMAECLPTGGNCTDQPLACCRGAAACAGGAVATRYCR